MSASEFQPAFPRVQQSNDFDDLFACVAMLTHKTLDEVRQVAIDKCKHPRHGPYWITQEFIIKLFNQFGLIATPYKELTVPLAELPPDVALLWIACDAENDVGRHVVFHRLKTGTGPKSVVEYVLDPAHWLDPAMQVRTDLKALQASWYIGVHPAKASSNGK